MIPNVLVITRALVEVAGATVGALKRHSDDK